MFRHLNFDQNVNHFVTNKINLIIKIYICVPAYMTLKNYFFLDNNGMKIRSTSDD